MAKFDKVLLYKITAKAVMPVHIGCSEEDVVILSDGEKPYIQANSISGSFGNYAEQKWGKIKKEKLFGSQEKSKIVFSDAEIDGKFGLELRPHVKINSRIGTAEDKGKFDVELLGAGVVIKFDITVFEKDGENFSELTEQLISDFNIGNIILGGQKTNGCGCFEIIKLRKAECNMHDKKQRDLYFDDKMDLLYDENKEEISLESESDFYTLEFTGEIEDSLIVKSGSSITQYGERFVDCETIKNSNNQYIVPGSSVKGVIKNHIKTIADYINADIFLKEYNETEINPLDCIYFDDALISNSKTKLFHRIKIDKFTGGTYNSGKFDEIPVAGEIKIKIRVKKSIELVKPLIALILYSLRDLACGVISLGGLSSVGRGFVKGNEILIDGKTDNAFISECIGELQKVRAGGGVQ